MKRILCSFLMATLLCVLLPAALAQSPIGDSGKLRDYDFTLVGAELGEDLLFEELALTLHFSFTNNSDSGLVGIPLEVHAFQRGEELYCSMSTLKVESGDIMPGDTVLFASSFLLENEQDDVTFTISIFFNEEDGIFERTIGLGSLETVDTKAQEMTQTQAQGEPQSQKPSEVLFQIFRGKKDQKIDKPQKLDESQNNEDKKEQQGDERQSAYTFGIDVLASIPAIVGYRECPNTSKGTGLGYEEQAYTYISATVRDDLLAYIDYLGENRFEIVRGAPLGDPGEGELIGESKDEGKWVRILLNWTDDTYTIHIIKEDGSRYGQSTRNDQEDNEPDLALREQGRALMDEGCYEEALTLYNAAIADHPGVAAYYADRWLALFELDAFDEALDSLNTAISLDASCWVYFNDRGYVHYCLDQYEEAIADFEVAIDLDPTNDSAHYSLACIQMEMGALEEAVLTCAFGVSAFPDSGDLWCLLGDIQFALKHYSEAVSAYDKAINLGMYEDIDLKDYLEAKEKAGTASNPTQQPLALMSGASKLQNFEDWIRPYVDVMPFQESILDSYMYSNDLGNGLVEEAVGYPSEWPNMWLDGAVPTYTGAGWMYDMFVVHPNMSYAAEDIRHVSVTVYDYLADEVDAYIAELLGCGFREVQDDRYSANWVDSVRSFRSPVCSINIIYAEGGGAVFRVLAKDEDLDALQSFVQFNVDFFREPYKLDTSITQNTEMLNYEELLRLTNDSDIEPIEMDQVTDSETDKSGRLYQTIDYPSRWPKHIFGEIIPEYKSLSIIYDMEVTLPAENPSYDQTLIASLYLLVNFDAQDVEDYVRQLVAFGYHEVPQEAYSEQEEALHAERDMFRIFTLPSVRVYLAKVREENLDLLQITLRFDGRYQNFNNQ